MRLFYVTEELDVSHWHNREMHDFRCVIRSPERDRRLGKTEEDVSTISQTHTRLRPPPGKPGTGSLYFSTYYETQALAQALLGTECSDTLKVLTYESTLKVLKGPGIPQRLGYPRREQKPLVPLAAQMDALGERDGVKVALINTFHPAYGDAVVSTTALRELHARLTERFGTARIDLYQARYNAEADRLYARIPGVGAIRPLPAPLTELMEYDAYVDFSADMIDWQRPWIDALMEAIAVDPASVPPERKRIRMEVDEEIARELGPEVERARADGTPVLLFHPLASNQIRTIPAERIPALLDALLERTGWRVASAVPVDYSHPRFLDWSGLSRTFQHLVYLVSRADVLLSVDTSVYHVSDAFDVPGVVIFTSIPPELRIAHYPNLRGIMLQPGNRLTGLHGSMLPENVEYAATLWDSLDVGELVESLEGAFASRGSRYAAA